MSINNGSKLCIGNFTREHSDAEAMPYSGLHCPA
jgi:hypothetical protein